MCFGASARQAASVWLANSRVGERIRTVEPFFCLIPRFWSIGSKKAAVLPVPVIASGGGGTMQHFVDVFNNGKADAALAASIFHFKEIAIPELKGYLQEHQIAIRI